MYQRKKTIVQLILILISLLYMLPVVAQDYQSETLKIKSLTPKTFIHKSYLNVMGFGKVTCNGMVYVSEGEAIVFDTPTTDSTAHELIGWIENRMNARIIAIVVSHFHDDCLGGLKAFHEAGIESYANNLTIQLAKEQETALPRNGFDHKYKLEIGSNKIINSFPGEGHTLDNIVSYIPSEKVLYGGCLVKSLNAGKGYLGDANVNEWSNTVEKVKK